MNKILLKELKISNFKGFCKAEKTFGEKEIIDGMNGQGKSSYFDAYRWCLGFNINGYEPMILPNNTRVGRPDKPCNTEVCAWIEKDGLVYKLKRISNQEWKNGEFVKNNGRYYFDSETEIGANLYKEKVASLIGCSYSDLEIIIDIAYFNSESPKWTWANRRKWLFEKLDIDNDEIDIQKSLNAEKAAIKKAQEDNLILIEDKQKQLLNYSSIDFVALKSKLAELQKEYEKLLLQNNKTNKGSVVAEMQSKLNSLLSEIDKERNNIFRQEKELSDRKFKLTSKQIELQGGIMSFENDKLLYNHEIEELEIEIGKIGNSYFPELATICQHCGQELPKDKIVEHVAAFEKNKEKTLVDLANKVNLKCIAIQNATDKANTLTEQLQAVQSQLKALDSEVIDKSRLEDLESEKAQLEDNIANLKMQQVKDTIADKIEFLKVEMENVNKELGKETIVEDLKNTIETLKANSLKLTAQEQMRLRKQAQLKKYMETMIALVDEKINSYFEGVTFRFFKENGANAENPWESTCECLVDGLSYRDCTSTGTKAIANIQTTIGVQKILGVSVPLWVDELAVITSDIDCDGYQFIGLQATRGKKLDNVLRVDSLYSIQDCIVRGEK